MSYVCCFTGHRDISVRHAECIVAVLDNTLEKLIASGVTLFRAGGALGFDTLVALKVLEKKNRYPQISLHLCLPCKDQTVRWGEYDKRVYDYILNKADCVSYVADKYYRGCMLARNRQLVNGADFCVSYCNKNTGGTAYTVNYAKEHNVKIINVHTLCEDALKQ